MPLSKIIALFVLCLFSAGCAQHTAFVSDPPGARVLVDGRDVGVTPCLFPYRVGTGCDYEVVVEKEGYQAMYHTLRTDEVDRQARNRWLAAGVVWSPLWLGALFTKKLRDGYEFILKKADVEHTAQNRTAPSETHLNRL
jgi:hypothetical protein